MTTRARPLPLTSGFGSGTYSPVVNNPGTHGMMFALQYLLAMAACVLVLYLITDPYLWK